MVSITKSVITYVNTKPLKAIEKYNESDIREILDYAYVAYHEKGDSILSDAVYDLLRDKYPRNEVGAPVMEGEKVKLPYWLGSMDKKKEVEKIVSNVVISDKLDGVSGLLVIQNGKAQLLTRGNGSVGRDVSRLIPHLNVNIPKEGNIVVRGELVMKRAIFESLSNGESNARNTVAGFVNSKKPSSSILKGKIDFVAYEVMEPAQMIPSKQMKYLSSVGLNVVHYTYSNGITGNELRQIYETRNMQSEYDMDGIIVAKDETYELVKKGNPKHAFAFKLNPLEQESGETTVIDVQWNISKDGFYKPTVLLTPLNLKGVIIRKATGHNAKFIVENGIGKDAVVRIIRSGDVIPRIVEVITKTNHSVPEGNYKWNETKVDFVATGEVDEKQMKKALVYTITKLGFDNMKEKTVHTLYDAGFDTLGKIISLTSESIKGVNKMQGKQGEKIIEAITERMKELSCIDFAIASNMFGRGVSTSILTKVNEIHPIMTSVPTVDELVDIESIGTKTAEIYLEGLPKFHNYIVENGLTELCNKHKTTTSMKTQSSNQEQTMQGKIAIFTGFRDAELEKKFTNAGGEVSSSFSKKVNLLVYADGKREKSFKKIETALERGDVEIMSNIELKNII